jgi:hypothetical protein
MSEDATGESHSVPEPPEEDVLYSAEIRHAEGQYVLAINDYLCSTVEVYVLPNKAVKKVPIYLSVLRSKLA